MKRIKYINLFETKNEYDNSLNELPNVSLNYISEIDKCKIILKEEEDLIPETRFVFVDGQNQVMLSSIGDVIIESVQGGEKVRETYSALNDTSVTINADAGNEVVIYGAVTKINQDENSNIFASIDVRKNTALTYLDCNNCTGLTSLDVSKNTALAGLDCYGCTGLTSLDVSKNTALAGLNCYNCPGLTSLDVSKNTALIYLDCSSCTGLTSLDVSKNTALTYLDCNNCTGLTSLDFSKNTALASLDCNSCQNLIMLNIKNTAELNGSTILDQSMANLTTLQVAGTSEWAYGEVKSWFSDYAPVGGTIYVDENTPQSIITEAQGKSWTVEYVN